MKTKRIWMWSIVFGLFATLIVYVALFSNMSVVTSTGSESKKGDEKPVETEEVGTAEETVVSREISNNMLEVSEGKRAISIKVALEEGVSGYITPGSFVDVIAYETIIDKEKDQESKSAILILQNKRVLGSGKASDSEGEALLYETVTLEVDPKDGVTLGLAAKDEDGFYLMLRNEADQGIEKEVKQTRNVNKEADAE